MFESASGTAGECCSEQAAASKPKRAHWSWSQPLSMPAMKPAAKLNKKINKNNKRT